MCPKYSFVRKLRFNVNTHKGPTWGLVHNLRCHLKNVLSVHRVHSFVPLEPGLFGYLHRSPFLRQKQWILNEGAISSHLFDCGIRNSLCKLALVFFAWRTKMITVVLIRVLVQNRLHVCILQQSLCHSDTRSSADQLLR